MENQSGIKPKGHRVLILPDQVEETTASGIVLHTATQLDREALGAMFGVVVAMGNTCYADQPEPWCAIGERVSFGRYSGLIYTGKDEKKYRMISDLDVVAEVEIGVK